MVGKVQGSFEVAYLQSLLNNGLTLPKIGCKVRTPLGLYFPDFEFEDRFIEVKSKFTLSVCKGEQFDPKGCKSDKQYRKIIWTTNNVKPVDIVVIDNKEAVALFRQAIQNSSLISEKITFKNGKYIKTEEIFPGT